MKIMHVGDLHIGSFPGPDINGENGRFIDCKNALSLLYEDAAIRRPDFIIIAGDVFHQAKVWSDRGLKEQALCVDWLRKMRDIAPVLVMRGTPNHDSMEQFNMLRTAFRGDDRVSIVTDIEMSMYMTNAGPVQVACVPGFDRSLFANSNTGDESDGAFYSRELDRLIRDMGSSADLRVPSVLTAHYTVAGANMESGQSTLFSEVEPVLTQELLQQAGFDLVCLGHVHRAQQFQGPVRACYCGGMMQFNFGDEGQPRGFWVHDVSVRGGTVASEFVPVSGREHQTILLGDPQISDIIDGKLNMAAWPNLRGKIVRVKYSCTDTHRKQLNQAGLEKDLRAAGAYYVAEISPVKVSRTVSGLSMTEDNTPRANLEDYLLERKTSPAEVPKLLDLAQPMLDALDTGSTAGSHSGMMIPVNITVKNYRNYVDESFNFEHVQFCTINGENGVGKSSLFMDAICDALYEEPREGDLAGWIRNDPAVKSGAIEFTFRLGDELFRITRKRAKSGKVTLQLEQLVDGAWENRSCSKARDTQTRIEELIGMDCLTFKACALIMQNQYGLFMEADREARMDILGNILGLGDYDRLEQMAVASAQDLNRRIRDVKTKIDTVMAGTDDLTVTEGELNTVRGQAAKIKAQLSALESERTVVKNQVSAMSSALERARQTTGWLVDQKTERQKQQALLDENVAIISDAERILAEEPAVNDGLARYKKLMDAVNEKRLAGAAYQGKAAVLDDLRKRKSDMDAKLSDLTAREHAAKEELSSLREELAGLPSLEREHGAYLFAKKAADEANEAYGLHLDRLKKITALETERNRVHAKLEAALIEQRSLVDSMNKRVSLLDTCNCVDISRAQCSFLADAREAQAGLGDAQREMGRLEQALAGSDAEYDAKLEALRSELDSEAGERKKRADEKVESLRLSETAYQQTVAKASLEASAVQRVAQAETDCALLADELVVLMSQVEAAERDMGDFEVHKAELQQLEQDVLREAVWQDKADALSKAKTRVVDAARTRDSLVEKLASMDKTIADMEQSVKDDTQAAGELDVVKKKLDELDASIQKWTEQSDAVSVSVGQLQAKCEDIRKRLDECDGYRQELLALQEDVARCNVLKQAFSIDGIRHNIIRSVMPVLEMTATSILSQMSRGRMSVEFKTEKVLKSNKNKEVTTLDIIVQDAATGALPYASRSGGEKVKVSLSVILALAEIRSRKEGVSVGFLFIDEPPYLDGAGTQVYCDALEAVQQRYSDLKIMAITHDISMKSRFPQSVDVIKTPNGSKLVKI